MEVALRKQPRLFLLLAVLLLVAREPESWFSPRFWAEDSVIYLKQSWDLGWHSLWALQAGYLVVVQRILALLIAPLPAAFIPAAYNFSAWALTLLVAWKVFRLRIAGLPNALLALAVVAVPENGEVFGCLTNIQWILALVLVLLPLQDVPRTWGGAAEDACWFLGAALTGPYIILTWPLYLARLWRSPKERYARALFIGATLCASLQAAMVIQSPPLAEPPLAAGISSTGALGDSPWIIWTAVVANRLFGGLFFAQTLTRLLPRPVNALLGVAFVLLLARLLFRTWPRWSREERFFAGGTLATLVLFFAVTSYRFIGHTQELLPFGLGDRYFVPPRILLLWVLLALATTLRPKIWPVITVLLFIVSWGVTRHYRYHFEDDHWAHEAPLLDSGLSVHFTTNPTSMAVELRRPR